MIKFVSYDNINKFTDDVMYLLLKHEIQNNLIISNCLRGKDGMDTANWFMGAVRDGKGNLKIIALMTPPHNLVIYEVDNTLHTEGVEVLAHEMINSKIPVPGVLAEKTLAGRFASLYSSLSDRAVKDGKKMRIYRLDRVNDLPLSPGKMRKAEQKDLYYLPYWNIAFDLDCGFGMVDISDSVNKVRRLLNESTLYIWEDDFPVSQAAMGRRTVNGAIVNAVYTPPHYRGKGYATSCVSSLSQYLLGSGYKFCSLFTDLANPVSNSIYMKMGYRPICDYDEYRFTEVPG